jgi:hypothetical protein
MEPIFIFFDALKLKQLGAHQCDNVSRFVNIVSFEYIFREEKKRKGSGKK